MPKSNGKIKSTQGFLNAWAKACASTCCKGGSCSEVPPLVTNVSTKLSHLPLMALWWLLLVIGSSEILITGCKSNVWKEFPFAVVCWVAKVHPCGVIRTTTKETTPPCHDNTNPSLRLTCYRRHQPLQFAPPTTTASVRCCQMPFKATATSICFVEQPRLQCCRKREIFFSAIHHPLSRRLSPCRQTPIQPFNPSPPNTASKEHETSAGRHPSIAAPWLNFTPLTLSCVLGKKDFSKKKMVV